MASEAAFPVRAPRAVPSLLHDGGSGGPHHDDEVRALRQRVTALEAELERQHATLGEVQQTLDEQAHTVQAIAAERHR